MVNFMSINEMNESKESLNSSQELSLLLLVKSVFMAPSSVLRGGCAIHYTADDRLRVLVLLHTTQQQYIQYCLEVEIPRFLTTTTDTV